MRKLVTLFLLVIAGSVSAQTLSNYEEVVYLKNGSIIRGIIIEEIPGKSVKIQTRERNVFVYQFDEIEKLTKEIPPENAGGNNSSARKQKGFNMYIDNGLALWITDPVLPTNMLTVTAGYKVNRLFFIGGGVGLIARKGFASVPVMVDMRLTLTKTKVAPLIQLNAGYMTKNLLAGDADNYYVSTDSYGGFIFGFKPGMGINLKKDIDLNFYTGYQLGSQVVSTSGYYSDNSTDFGLMHMFVITAGVKF